MTYLELIRDAEHKLESNEITFGEYNELIEPLRREIEQESCESCISREDTLKAMIEQLGIRNEDYLLPAEATLYKVVKNMPPVTPQPKTGHWIPVSERLPEKNVEVLATTEWGAVTIAEMYSVNDWFIHEGTTNAETDEIVAWMPLPEPYEPQESEE